MNESRVGNASGIRKDSVDLIPAKHLVRGDMERLTDCLIIAKQSDKTFGKVFMMKFVD